MLHPLESSLLCGKKLCYSWIIYTCWNTGDRYDLQASSQRCVPAGQEAEVRECACGHLQVGKCFIDESL